MQCCRYVDLNPVKAGLVASAEEYRWSSYRAKVGLDTCEWLDFDALYTAHSAPEDNYRCFVNLGINEDEQRFIRRVLESNQLTGGSGFVDEVEARLGVRIEQRGRGRLELRDK